MVHTPVPAGWYPQPDNTMRYWDGHAWTEYVHQARRTGPVVFDGIRWLGVRWGRQGKPTLARALGITYALIATAFIMLGNHSDLAVMWEVIGGVHALVAIAHLVEGHFAARVVREQQPRIGHS